MADIFNILRDNGLLLLIGQYPNGPLGGLAITFLVSVLGIGLAFPLSVVMALALVSPIKWIRRPVLMVVYLLRGVPLVMLIFWVYFLVRCRGPPFWDGCHQGVCWGCCGGLWVGS